MRKICRSVWLLLFLCTAAFNTSAQKQLIVLKNQKVLLRLYPGDEFVFSLKDSKKKVRKSYINNLFDTAVVAHKDIVPFHKIDRIYFKRGNLANVVGGLLVVGGAGYFLIDQFNVVVVQGENANISKNVAVSSAVMVGAGLPLMLLRKKYVRIGGRFRIRMVDQGSGFYVPDMRREADSFDRD